MRLWTLHPKYLDSKGLVALWREALLAQAVLKGQTQGYKHHPQLVRFSESEFPLKAISKYLELVYEESKMRGYNFDSSKFERYMNVDQIPVTVGQLDFEWKHLLEKLKNRDAEMFFRIKDVSNPEAHPLFAIIPGQIAEWEIVIRKKKKPRKI